MKRTVKGEAIVLKKRSLPDQDIIITLFLKDYGKIVAFAKGIKKITSRRLPHIQKANLIKVVLYFKNDRYYLQQTDLISGFSLLKKNRDKVNLLYIYFFVIDRLLPERQPESQMYNLLKTYLKELSKSKKPDESILTVYLNRTLSILGFAKESKPYNELRTSIEEIIHEKIPELHL